VHPLAKRKIVSLGELNEFQFALTEASFGLRQQIDRIFRSYGFQPQVFCVTNSLALLKEVVTISPQCTLLRRFAVEHEVRAGTLCTIAVREFAADPFSFCICTLNRRTVSPAAQVFADIAVDYCRRYRR
jgi:DNA-binding transcriptional LysR family regulator